MKTEGNNPRSQDTARARVLTSLGPSRLGRKSISYRNCKYSIISSCSDRPTAFIWLWLGFYFYDFLFSICNYKTVIKLLLNKPRLCLNMKFVFCCGSKGTGRKLTNPWHSCLPESRVGHETMLSETALSSISSKAARNF